MRERTGRNDGDAVRAYLQSVGLGEGLPYCWAGQYWAFLQVTAAPPILRTGLCSAGWNDAVRRGRIVPYEADVGDLIVWRYVRSTFGHVERIDSVGTGGWVVTIAMNVVCPASSRHPHSGGGVCVRRRNIRHPLGRMLLRGLIGRDKGVAQRRTNHRTDAT